tara:strand:- start:366 stop:611 length:246 start_codon:yes stop_codon:yes gene_type:complete
LIYVKAFFLETRHHIRRRANVVPCPSFEHQKWRGLWPTRPISQRAGLNSLGLAPDAIWPMIAKARCPDGFFRGRWLPWLWP